MKLPLTYTVLPGLAWLVDEWHPEDVTDICVEHVVSDRTAIVTELRVKDYSPYQSHESRIGSSINSHSYPNPAVWLNNILSVMSFFLSTKLPSACKTLTFSNSGQS